jgi:NAD(P)H-dependent FMN reductase
MVNMMACFLAKIESADLLVVSMAEHNGNYSTASNIFDWCTELMQKFSRKPMLC